MKTKDELLVSLILLDCVCDVEKIKAANIEFDDIKKGAEIRITLYSPLNSKNSALVLDCLRGYEWRQDRNYEQSITITL